MPGKRELVKEKPARRGWKIPVIAVAAALVCAYAGLCVSAAGSSAIAPHTVVGGVDVGGMTRTEAAQAIERELDALCANSGVHVTLTDGEEAAYLSYDELGVTFDAEKLAEDAYQSSRSGGALANGWRLLRARLGRQTEITPMPDNNWTGGAAQKLADACSIEAEDFTYELTDDELLLTKPRDGRRVDRAELRSRLDDAAADASGDRSVELPYTTVAAEHGNLDAINDQLGGEMANARYDAETDTIIPESVARHFDPAEARRLMSDAEPGETVRIGLEKTEPTITAEDLKKVLFRDVLGSYTTRVGGAPGRRANVKLTAKRVNGAVLNSGEEFNYYTFTGPFSAANGYQSAPGYLHGKTVEMDGGGACQCSSTTYAAALLANMEIVRRTAHGFASDYIGLGLDATVSGGGPDFIFRNNTPYPVKVQAIYENDRLTVNIIGTKTDDITVKMRSAVLTTTPYEEEIVEDPTLAPGERVVEQTPYTGYTVNTYRQLYDGAGNLISEKFEAFSRYNKRNRIIHVGPALDPDAPPVDAPPDGTGDTPPVDVPPVDTPPVDNPPVDTPPAEEQPPAEPPVETPPAEQEQA